MNVLLYGDVILYALGIILGVFLTALYALFVKLFGVSLSISQVLLFGTIVGIVIGWINVRFLNAMMKLDLK